MSASACNLCAFFVPVRIEAHEHHDPADGRCQRFPPTVVCFGERVLWLWPGVDLTDKCGEFCPIEEAKA